MKCKICNRTAIKQEFCLLHLQAYQNILEKFEKWKMASDVSWTEYLGMIQKNSLTGEWAKDVAKHLMMEGKENVK
jgi:hypothetical protein